jgi:hypothetical protein
MLCSATETPDDTSQYSVLPKYRANCALLLLESKAIYHSESHVLSESKALKARLEVKVLLVSILSIYDKPIIQRDAAKNCPTDHSSPAPSRIYTRNAPGSYMPLKRRPEVFSLTTACTRSTRGKRPRQHGQKGPDSWCCRRGWQRRHPPRCSTRRRCCWDRRSSRRRTG